MKLLKKKKINYVFPKFILIFVSKTIFIMMFKKVLLKRNFVKWELNKERLLIITIEKLFIQLNSLYYITLFSHKYEKLR